MEKEKIITLTEILDYSEDEEPPSGGESKVSTFAFACVDDKVLQLSTLKFPLLGSLSNLRRNSTPKVYLLRTTWHYPVMGIAVFVFQISTFWYTFNNFQRSIFLNFRVSLYNSLNHFIKLVENCLVKQFGTIGLDQCNPVYKSITSNQISRLQLITIKNR